EYPEYMENTSNNEFINNFHGKWASSQQQQTKYMGLNSTQDNDELFEV
ncbi:11913_t:CDS:2, partial [Ambispora gerdemannii]